MNNEFWAQVKDITSIAKGTFQVTFSYDEGSLKHAAGQYIWVMLPRLSYPDLKGEMRAFSITSSISNTDSFTIQFRNSDSGYKKTLLSLPNGSKVKIIGPFGSSYVPSKKYKKVVLIAGGVGIAPFLSILRSLEQTDIDIQYTLIYVNSSPELGVFNEELTNITSLHNFPFINYIGSINETLFPTTLNYEEDIFFICGPKGMVDEVYKILTSKGVSFEHMRFEQHYPSTADNLTEQDFIQKPEDRNIMLQAVQASKNHVIITDTNGQIVFANKKAQENTGFTFDEMKGNTPRLWGGLMTMEFYNSFWHKKHEKVGFDGEIKNRRKNGEIYYVLAHISPINNDKNEVIGYIGTEEDITKEKQIDQAKTEFISLASHQLRTPLSTINWYCEMLLSGDAGQISDEQKRFVQEAYGGSQRMSKLVNALLNVSRIESGTYMVDPQNVNIIKLTRSILDESKPQIDEKKLTVTLENEDIPEIMLDPSLMTIILQNLLTNSVKYTPIGGKITVFLKQIRTGELLDNKPVTQDNLLIQVEDNGIGIPTSQRNQIFQKLFRADNVRRSNTDGTGLGLYLIKSLIEHSSGRIWFISEEGKGTSFFVSLPISGMIKKEGIKKLE